MRFLWTNTDKFFISRRKIFISRFEMFISRREMFIPRREMKKFARTQPLLPVSQEVL